MTSLPLEILCHRLPACIISRDNQRLRLAVTELPSDETREALRFASQCQVEFECWPLARIEKQNQTPGGHFSAALPHDNTTPGAARIAEQLLHQAIRLRASDIHLESGREGLVVRLRIDGILRPCPLPAPCAGETLIARFKVLAGADIAENRLPQDAQLSLEINGENHCFRLSTLPTRFGEKLVLRRLQILSSALTPEQLGLAPQELEKILSTLRLPQGMILVTGPTGSGKTFTLYNLLNQLNTAKKNLSSVEDPIEMTIPGVNQTQINSRAGLDFARILRALLRQDPDVIMIGEIRDNETADIAVKAAQTGHLVLSTLHTNSTPETLIRLRQMGIPGYLLAASLRLVIAQRLVRKLCPRCRQPSEALLTFPAGTELKAVSHWLPGNCDHCFGGYYGRMALFEILPVCGELHHAITGDASAEKLRTIATRQGMQSLFMSGINAVVNGDTSWAEVLRITGGISE